MEEQADRRPADSRPHIQVTPTVADGCAYVVSVAEELVAVDTADRIGPWRTAAADEEYSSAIPTAAGTLPPCWQLPMFKPKAVQYANAPHMSQLTTSRDAVGQSKQCLFDDVPSDELRAPRLKRADEIPGNTSGGGR